MAVSRTLAEGSCYGERSGPRFTLAVPYHRDWPRAALDLGGKYLARSSRWRFHESQAPAVARTLLRLFGWSIFSRWPSHYAPVLICLTEEPDHVSSRPVAPAGSSD